MEAVRRLLDLRHRGRTEDLPLALAEVATFLDADEVAVLLVDYEQISLWPLRGTPPDGGAHQVDATVAGHAFRSAEVRHHEDEDGFTLWLPLLHGAERLGVLKARLKTEPEERLRDDLRVIAALVAELIASRRFYGDAVEHTRRRLPMQLAAEIIWNQLPPLTFAANDTIVTAVLEPCYDVGGDAFDYAVNGDTAHVALFDAAGHGSAGGMRSVMLASLALASYRNARRAGMDLIGIYHHIDDAVRAHDRYGMITAVLAEIDQRTGLLRVISAGHPSGIVIRRGQVVKVLPTPTALPVTLGDQRPPVVVEESLEPGDRVLLYTDGIIEARSADGVEFGLDRLIEFAVKAEADHLPAPETTRRLVHAILDLQDDRLQDDATVLLVEWRNAAPPRSDTELPVAPADDPLSPGDAAS